MRGYLLDTSALSAYYYGQHQHHARAVALIDGLEADALLLVSVITIAELEYGIRLAEFHNSSHLPELRERVTRIKSHGQLPVTHHTSDVYAGLKFKLAQTRIRPGKKKMPRFLEDWADRGSGKVLQIDENDLWICAQTKERDLTLITTDTDFRAFEAADRDIRILFVQP